MALIHPPPGQGIVITITIPKLEDQLSAQGYVTPADYIDFLSEKAEIPTPAFVYHYKRKAFKHEGEVRAIIDKMWDGRNPDMDGSVVRAQSPDPKGMPPEDQLVEVDLVDLIKSVIVSPDSEDWFLKVVQRATKSSLLKDLDVKLSSLSIDPVYANISI